MRTFPPPEVSHVRWGVCREFLINRACITLRPGRSPSGAFAGNQATLPDCCAIAALEHFDLTFCQIDIATIRT